MGLLRELTSKLRRFFWGLGGSVALGEGGDRFEDAKGITSPGIKSTRYTSSVKWKNSNTPQLLCGGAASIVVLMLEIRWQLSGDILHIIQRIGTLGTCNSSFQSTNAHWKIMHGYYPKESQCEMLVPALKSGDQVPHSMRKVWVLGKIRILSTIHSLQVKFSSKTAIWPPRWWERCCLVHKFPNLSPHEVLNADQAPAIPWRQHDSAWINGASSCYNLVKTESTHHLPFYKRYVSS